MRKVVVRLQLPKDISGGTPGFAEHLDADEVPKCAGHSSEHFVEQVQVVAPMSPG